MSWLDWAVLTGTLAFTILYGLYRSRGSDTVDNYLLAGKSIAVVRHGSFDHGGRRRAPSR
jgi:Na+/proline symporter